MLVMQEDGKLRSYGFALRRRCLIEEMILHLLGQVVSDTDSLKMMAGISPAINANDAIQTARAKISVSQILLRTGPRSVL